jgi:hypothetical protein
MFKWFKRKLAKWVREIELERDTVPVDEYRPQRKSTLSRTPEPRSSFSKGTNFTVYQASGGFIIETGYYDVAADVQHQTLHIINDDEDLGNSIGKILTIEHLKR